MTAGARYAVSRHDRAFVLYGLIGVTVIAWIYLLAGAGMSMDGMDMGDGHVTPMLPAWTLGQGVLVFLMWAIMMVAMMLPSVAPTILRTATASQSPPAPTSGVQTAVLVTSGYLTVWTAFSLAATLLQWALDRTGLLSDEMASRSTVVAAGILLVAGAYQLTSWKQAFLRDCRMPMLALDPVRKDPRAAFRTGVRLGLHCLGCCWALMGLLFVVGVMNVLWAAMLALLVVVEKTLPQGSRVSRLAGAALIAWGCCILVTATF